MKRAARLRIYTPGLLLILVAIYETGSRFWRTETYEADAVLGWRLKPGVKATFKMRDASGPAYVAEFSTDSLGMRSYGSIASGTSNVLVIGDSFTADQCSGNQDMWFSVMVSRGSSPRSVASLKDLDISITVITNESWIASLTTGTRRNPF